MIIGLDLRSLNTTSLTGVGLYAQNLFDELIKLDKINQYKLFLNSRKSQPAIIEKWLTNPNVKLYHYKIPSKFLNLSLLLFNRPYLDKLIGGCDIFLMPNLNFWSFSPRVRINLIVHDLSFKIMPEVFSRHMRNWHNWVKPSQLFKRCEKIIAVSNNTKHDLMDHFKLSAERIVVIYPGLDRPTKVNEHVRVRQKYNLPQKYFLYLGTLEPRKNIISLIKAFESFSDPSYSLIIGGKQGWLYRDIKKAIKKSSATARIQQIGYVADEDKSALYAMAQALVWPSLYEGFGYPPLEAMAVGCPVITSANSSLIEVVGEAALLVDPYNINEIAEGMNQLINDQELRQSLITKGYKQVGKFSREKTVTQLLELLR